jgi:hypothetical protein
MTCVLLQIDDSQFLRLFELQQLQNFIHRVLLECFHLEFEIGRHMPSRSDGLDSLWVFGLLSPEDNRSLPRVPFDLMVKIHFGCPALQASGVSTLNSNSQSYLSEVNDMLTHVSW